MLLVLTSPATSCLQGRALHGVRCVPPGESRSLDPQRGRGEGQADAVGQEDHHVSGGGRDGAPPLLWGPAWQSDSPQRPGMLGGALGRQGDEMHARNSLHGTPPLQDALNVPQVYVAYPQTASDAAQVCLALRLALGVDS